MVLAIPSSAKAASITETFLSPGSFNLLNGATNAASSLPTGFSYLASLGNNDLDASITALASEERASILQRPRIQTSHAVPASIFVGQSRPYPLAVTTAAAPLAVIRPSNSSKSVCRLKVTPLINPDGLVVMDIHNRDRQFHRQRHHPGRRRCPRDEFQNGHRQSGRARPGHHYAGRPD